MACTPFILDGGLSTELEERGFHIQGDPLWSARILHTNPGAVKDVHNSFLQCGSDVITTATYQASVEGFIKHLGVKSEEAENLIMSGVRLAKESAVDFMASCLTTDRKAPLVAGSVGPFGAFLHDGSEYTGVYASSMSVEELKNWHRPQIRCLVAAGADLLALETIPSLKEAEALVELLREFPDAKAWLSFSCRMERKKDSLYRAKCRVERTRGSMDWRLLPYPTCRHCPIKKSINRVMKITKLRPATKCGTLFFFYYYYYFLKKLYKYILRNKGDHLFPVHTVFKCMYEV
ncbi:homocysteine S-methyltransferase YbgG isoform 2-T2 [Clarias gariepinus]